MTWSGGWWRRGRGEVFEVRRTGRAKAEMDDGLWEELIIRDYYYDIKVKIFI